MDSETKTVIEQRKEKNSIMFFIPVEVVKTFGKFELVKKKNLYGVNKGDDIILEPIYDEIIFLKEHLCKLRIKNIWALANIVLTRLLLDFSYADIYLSTENLVTTVGSDGMKGLYHADLEYEIIPPEYDEFGSPIGVEFIWIRKGEFYDFIEQSTGRLIRIGGISKAYDSESGMFGVNSSGRVIMIDSNGYEDPNLLRRTVMNAGGYLCLQNRNRKTEDYIDVYGNILNV